MHMPHNAGAEGDILRERYKREFAADEEMQSLADCNPPARRTKAQSVASGNRVLSGEASKKDEAFHDVDHHTMMLWYHDKIKHTLYDLAHEFANVIKHMFNWMKDTTTKDKKRFTSALRAYELNQMNRFQGLRPQEAAPGRLLRKYPSPPWTASRLSQANVDGLPAVCKVPIGWPAYRKMFADLGHAKTSESILLAGDVGAYTLRHCDVDSNIRALFIRVLRLIQRSSDAHSLLKQDCRTVRTSINRLLRTITVRFVVLLTLRTSMRRGLIICMSARIGVHSRSAPPGTVNTCGRTCRWSWLNWRS